MEEFSFSSKPASSMLTMQTSKVWYKADIPQDKDNVIVDVLS